MDGKAYTDGSYFADSSKCGSAAVMDSGKVYMARPPGHPGIYKADLVALYLAALHSPQGGEVCTESHT